MADNTHIEWTDATWNIITGCSHKSPGCKNCYAQALAGSRLKHHPSRIGLTTPSKTGPVFNGEVRFNAEWLTQPLQWKRPRKVFVCAHGDLFHENVPDAWIDQVFAVMALAPQHTFQVLTKRSARMREYLSKSTAGINIADYILGKGDDWGTTGAQQLAPLGNRAREEDPSFVVLPLPNVWLGVSVEDQKRADERIPDLLSTPAAVRWISAEPLLGPVELHNLPNGPNGRVKALTGETLVSYGNGDGDYDPEGPRLDWVVVGGESGPNARPMHPDWARSLRDQCASAGVPFLFKQWGAWKAVEVKGATVNLRTLAKNQAVTAGSTPGHHTLYTRIGKKRAGRLLDGIEHNGYPEVRHG